MYALPHMLTTVISEESSSSTTGGISVSVGYGASGLNYSGSISSSASSSQAQSDGTSYTNALVAAGGNITTSSGNDTNVQGANIQGETVAIAVGRDFNVESLQDTSQNSGSSWSVGGSIGFDATGSASNSIAGTVGIDVTDASGLSINIGGSTSSGDMAWVNGQTSITAKDILNIYTENNTDIKGAVIASDSGDLILNTGTLTYTNLDGKMHQTSSGGNVGIGGLLKNIVASLDYANSKKEQINRATVGDGLIVVRDGDGNSLLSLNRNVALGQESTGEENVRMGMYFDSTQTDGETWAATWAGVNTLGGFTYGVAGIPFGAELGYHDGVMEFTNHPWGDVYSAVSLGHTIIYFEGANPEVIKRHYNSIDDLQLRAHERAHMSDAKKWGPFYILAYLAQGGWWTNSNPFELNANEGARETMKNDGTYYPNNPHITP